MFLNLMYHKSVSRFKPAVYAMVILQLEMGCFQAFSILVCQAMKLQE